MATLTNQNSNARSMNGISIVAADEIYSEDLSVGELTVSSGIKATSGQTIDFGSNSPIMNGTNITGIPSGSLPANIAYKNANNTFSATQVFSTGGIGDAIQIFKTGTSEYIFLNNNGQIGYWNGTSIVWSIDNTGTGSFPTTSNIPLKNVSNTFSATNNFSELNAYNLNLISKTFLQSVQFTNTTGSVFFLSFNSPEYVIISSNITTIVLPNPYNPNPTQPTTLCIGASFKFIRPYSTTSVSFIGYNEYYSITPHQYIVFNTTPRRTVIFNDTIFSITITCIDNQQQPTYSTNVWVADVLYNSYGVFNSLITSALENYAKLSAFNNEFTNQNTYSSIIAQTAIKIKNSSIIDGYTYLRTDGSIGYTPDGILTNSNWEIQASGLINTKGGIHAADTQVINFGTNAPTMSGSNISDVAKLNTDNTFLFSNSFDNITTFNNTTEFNDIATFNNSATFNNPTTFNNPATFNDPTTINKQYTIRDGATSSMRPTYQNPLVFYYQRVNPSVQSRYYFRSGITGGSDNITFDANTTVTYYMVGGGGGGAGNISTGVRGGGGGGAGQFLTGSFTALAGETYTLTTGTPAGAGSLGNATSVLAGSDGASVSITGAGVSITAIGGSGGLAHTSSGAAGKGGNGGNGGIGGNGGNTSGSIGQNGGSIGGGAGGSYNLTVSGTGNTYTPSATVDGVILSFSGGNGGANNATSGLDAANFGNGGGGGGGTGTQKGGNGLYGFILLMVAPYTQETYMFQPTYGITTTMTESSRLIATTEYVKNQYKYDNTFTNLINVNVPSSLTPTTSITGANGCIQVISNSSSSSVGKDGMSFKAGVDTNSIINFMNTAATLRGAIIGASSTSVTYSTTSDERLKQNISNMPSQLENIKSLSARSFNWKSTGEEDYGFIAQEIYKVYPILNPLKNNSNYDDKLYPVKTDGSNFVHMIDYGKMTPYLWSAVQELTLIVEKQQKQIDELILKSL